MIPFTQYLMPDGRKSPQEIDRPPDIEALAHAFIARGGAFECEMLRTGQVSFTAVAMLDGERQDIAIAVADNGPAVLDAVDKIVREAAAFQQDGPIIQCPDCPARCRNPETMREHAFNAHGVDGYMRMVEAIEKMEAG